jgi:hypothetical protein
MAKNLILAFILLVSAQLWAKPSDYTPYVIQKGDIVSQLLVDNSLTPLYGSKQWVEKVLKLNRLTYSSAKKLEPGDVIVLPKESFVFKKSEYQDKVSSIKSATEKRLVKKIRKEYLSEKKHNFTTSGEFFTQTYDYGGRDFVNIDQNFKLSVEYKNKNIKADNLAVNPLVRLNIITQSQASFNERENYSADFTPSYQLEAGAEIYSKKNNLGFSLVARAEQFSRMYFEDDDYEVRSADNFWAQAIVQKDFKNKKNTYFVGLDFARATNLDGQIIGGYIGAQFLKHYNLTLRSESANFTLGEEATQLSQSLNLGYRW